MTDPTTAPRSPAAAPDLPATDLWPRRPRLVSVVCPVYEEASGIAYFTEELVRVMTRLALPFEVIFVEDDSPDESLEVLRGLHRQRPEVLKILSLSRRFGHQSSLAAGFRFSRGDVVICMDSDMQHPPELLPELIYSWAQGAQLVYTRRRHQAGRSSWKEAASRGFYRLMDKMTDVTFEPGTADFRLMDEVVVSALNRFGERYLFFRGLVNWIGFRRTVVEFDAPERHSGASSYSWGRMLKMGIDGLFAFSLLPLRFSFLIGGLMMLFSWVYGLISVAGSLLGWFDVPGYTSLVVLLSFFGSLNLISLGIVGEYVGRIHEQVKDRPLFLIKESLGIDERLPTEPAGSAAAGEAR